MISLTLLMAIPARLTALVDGTDPQIQSNSLKVEVQHYYKYLAQEKAVRSLKLIQEAITNGDISKVKALDSQLMQDVTQIKTQQDEKLQEIKNGQNVKVIQFLKEHAKPDAAYRKQTDAYENVLHNVPNAQQRIIEDTTSRLTDMFRGKSNPGKDLLHQVDNTNLPNVDPNLHSTDFANGFTNGQITTDVAPPKFADLPPSSTSEGVEPPGEAERRPI
eukprot:NODE_732_length_4354_cov_0.742656.p4 type:complete len:218 gc:universal NODE_732_length_4354_cov_0.742656:2642-1989(-)